MRIKHLSRVGNSSALIIERPVLEMLDIDEQTPLKLSIEGRKLIIEPLSEEEIERRFKKGTDKVEKRFGKMFKRLAQR
jgi:antitoxin MazE